MLLHHQSAVNAMIAAAAIPVLDRARHRRITLLATGHKKYVTTMQGEQLVLQPAERMVKLPQHEQSHIS